MEIKCDKCGNCYPESFIYELHDNNGIAVSWICENCMDTEHPTDKDDRLYHEEQDHKAMGRAGK